jgi:hypothetical protein
MGEAAVRKIACAAGLAAYINEVVAKIDRGQLEAGFTQAELIEAARLLRIDYDVFAGCRVFVLPPDAGE